MRPVAFLVRPLLPSLFVERVVAGRVDVLEWEFVDRDEVATFPDVVAGRDRFFSGAAVLDEADALTKRTGFFVRYPDDVVDLRLFGVAMISQGGVRLGRCHSVAEPLEAGHSGCGGSP